MQVILFLAENKLGSQWYGHRFFHVWRLRLMWLIWQVTVVCNDCAWCSTSCQIVIIVFAILPINGSNECWSWYPFRDDCEARAHVFVSTTTEIYLTQSEEKNTLHFCVCACTQLWINTVYLYAPGPCCLHHMAALWVALSMYEQWSPSRMPSDPHGTPHGCFQRRASNPWSKTFPHWGHLVKGSFK